MRFLLIHPFQGQAGYMLYEASAELQEAEGKMVDASGARAESMRPTSET